MDDGQQRAKVHVQVGGIGESMWARPIEGELFAIANLPFFAFGLNFGDIVVAPLVGGVREVRAVMRPSGHQTLRLSFGAHVDDGMQREHLKAVEALGGSYERGTASLVAIDVPPSAPHDVIVALLDRLQASGELDFETCEARRLGAFDDGACQEAA